MFKKLFILILVLIAGTSGYFLGLNKKQPEKVIEPEIKQEIKPEIPMQFIIPDFQCPYVIKNSEYKKYVESANEITVVSAPQLILNGEIIKMNKLFNEKEFEKDLWPPDSDKKQWGSREFDVDNDNKDEMVINADVTMTQSPHIAMIVKDGNIIFEENGRGIGIGEVYGGNGFLLKEDIDRNTGEEKYTRYVPVDGGFKPVWTQKACWVSWE